MSKGLHSWTALHYAANSGCDEVCRVILESGQMVDVDTRTDDGQTALHLAVKRDSLEVVTVLVRFHADIRAVDRYGCTAYNYAVQSQSSLISQYLCLKEPSFAQVSSSVLLSRPFPDSALPTSPTATSLDTPDFHSSETYSVIKLLGKGAFAQVYLSLHKYSHQLFALKCIKKSLLTQPKIRKYVKTERGILMNMQHPFIQRLYACFQTPARLVLVLEYYNGGDLRTKLNKCGRISEEVVRIYAAEIYLALDFLHRKGVIYRDLKPENVMIDGKGHIRLIDFGLSKEDMDDHDLTASFCGSIGYIAPEMVAQKPYGKSIDWYMYGCLLYEMLTGQRLFQANDVSKLMVLIEKGKIAYPKEMSDKAKSLIQGLLVKDPGVRVGGTRSSRRLIKQHSFFEGVNWQEVYRKEGDISESQQNESSSWEEDQEEAIQAFGGAGSSSMFGKEAGWSFGDVKELYCAL